MNVCHFSGRLTRDAETRFTQGGTAVTTFSLAVDSGYGEHKRTDFLRCKLFKRDTLGSHLTKGKPVIVTGEYCEQKWTDQQGQERRMVEIIVRDLDFQHGQPASEPATGRAQAPSGSGAARQQQQASAREAFPGYAGGMDDVPF